MIFFIFTTLEKSVYVHGHIFVMCLLGNDSKFLIVSILGPAVVTL